MCMNSLNWKRKMRMPVSTTYIIGSTRANDVRLNATNSTIENKVLFFNVLTMLFDSNLKIFFLTLIFSVIQSTQQLISKGNKKVCICNFHFWFKLSMRMKCHFTLNGRAKTTFWFFLVSLIFFEIGSLNSILYL